MLCLSGTVEILWDISNKAYDYHEDMSLPVFFMQLSNSSISLDLPIHIQILKEWI